MPTHLNLCQIRGVPENPSLPRDELRATVEARRDLGPEYDSALVESFLEKVDTAIQARVRAEVAAQTGHGIPPGPHGAPQYGPPPPQKQHRQSDGTIPIALGSLGIGIPLTAIAASEAGPAGLFLAWVGIVVVNFAAAIGRRRNR
jgi:anti-sigma factor RsiW